MWLFLILLGFLQFNTTTDSEDQVFKESRSQAKFYVQQIQKGYGTDQHLWALTILSTENPRIKAFVEESTRDISGILSLFHEIEETKEQQLKKVVFETGSADLLIALLLSDISSKEKIYKNFVASFNLQNINGIRYRTLSNAIIQQEKITKQILPTQSFRLPHFFLISDKDWNQFIPQDYLQSIVNNWGRTIYLSTSKSLNLVTVTYLESLYQLYRYSDIAELYPSIDTNFFPNSSQKLRIYRHIDYSVYRTGRYDRNLELVRNRLLPLSKYLDDKIAELKTRQLLGVYLYSIGKLHKARNAYQLVLQEANDQNIPFNRTSLFNNLGITYLKLGEYDKYLDLQFQALETAKENENYPHQLEIYINLFIYHRRAQDFQNTLNYLKEAERIAQKIGDPTQLGQIYISFGSYHRQFTQDFAKAHQYYSKAEKTLDPNNDAMNYIYLLNEQAETYEQQKKFSQALAKHDRILSITSKEDNNPTYIDALVNKALVNLEMGHLQEVQKLITRFNSFQLQQLDFEQIVKANTVKADFFNRKGNPDEALQLLNPTIDQLLERAQSSTDLQSGFWHIADEYLDALSLAVSIHLQNEQPDKAVTILDRLKNINDASIYQNPLVKASLLNESELTKYKNITTRIDAKRKQFLTVSGNKKFTIKQKINELELQKRKFDRRISSQADSKPISISEVQAQLSAHQLVLHVTELKDQYYVAQISRSEVHIKVIPFDQKTRNLFTTSVYQVANHTTNLDSLYAISKLLKIKDIPARITDVTVIPDSYLYQLPIDILPLEQPPHQYSYGATKYFIEKYKTHYLTSLDAFKKNDQNISRPDYRWNYVGYGISNFATHSNRNLVPLPFADKEVESVKNQLTNLKNLQTFTNENSKKETFTNTASKARILHLATHSEISERDPLFSTIYLSQEDSTKTTDSFTDQLFAYELFGLNLNNDMIMLNSCKSGSGSYIQGTGIMGFSRALQYAGANSLVLNTWSVNDMLASDFAVYFYGQLNQGKSKAEALQNTKRYFLASKNASPHFWGPYMLIGNTDPILEPHKTMNLAMAGSFIFYFLLMVILSYLKHRGIILQPKQQY